MKKSITILGSTGSIGTQALEVIKDLKGFEVVAISANNNIKLFVEQCKKFRPKFVAIANKELLPELKDKISEIGGISIVDTNDSISDLVNTADSDINICAISGSYGIGSFYSALNTGKRILLANKESLVMAGSFFYSLLKENKSSLIPLDSEHYAIFSCLQNPDITKYPLVTEEMGVDKIILTASGGSFLNCSKKDLENITVEQACNHPTWSMGRKISIDSATLMNKALEIIEAYWLFGVGVDDIDVYIHPQSIIHSMVSFNNGSTISQMSYPDMKIPIAGALLFGEKGKYITKNNFNVLNNAVNLEFIPLDNERFSSISIAKNALKDKDSATLCLNAINEESVNAFLQKRIGFNDIMNVVEEMMSSISFNDFKDIDDIFYADRKAREKTLGYIAGIAK